MSKTFSLQTYGCRVNQYETQAVREQLKQKGFREALNPDRADLVVINSCTVTQRADQECLSTIRFLHRKAPGTRIVVMGCFVQRDSDRLRSLPGVRLLVGTGQKHRVADWVEELFSNAVSGVGTVPDTDFVRWEQDLSTVYSPLRISTFHGRSKAFVKVQDGCDRACAFCKIPYVRGRSRSRDLADILEEMERLVTAGFKEVVLTGVAIGLWGREWGRGLADLVGATDRLRGRFRVRLSSLDPRDLDDSLIEALVQSARFCRHLHLSLQSGSDPVLRRMNRGYTASEYQGRVEKVRSYWPDLGLTTDLIVGFPGESEAQFEETLRFCRQMRFARVHIFPYSARRGTSAWTFKGALPPEVVKERAKQLGALAAEGMARFCCRFVGTVQEVLAEEQVVGDGGQVQYLGYTGQFVRVAFQGPAGLVGRLVPVRIRGISSQGLRGGLFLTDTLDKMTPDQPSLLLDNRVGS